MLSVPLQKHKETHKNQKTLKIQKNSKGEKSQKGISLYVILIIIMLSVLLALWASKSAYFNELILSNDADYQRAFEAGQALLQDAELDIRGERADGSACVKNALKPDICRVVSPATKNSTVFFPDEDKELVDLYGKIEGQDTKCLKGVCLKRVDDQDFWNDKALFAKLTATDVAATYGQFTGASVSDSSNPVLNSGKAWYWIEIMPYAKEGGGVISGVTPMLALNLNPSVVYRITAIAQGRKPNTRVVLQSTFARQKIKN